MIFVRVASVREQVGKARIEACVRRAPGRIIAVFALVATASLWACAPAPAPDEPSPEATFSIGVASMDPKVVSAPLALSAAVDSAPADSVSAIGSSAKGESGTAPPPRGAPTVRASEPTVGPSYSPELIKAVMRRSMPGVRDCASKASSPGRGSLTFTIEADGRVKEAAYVSGGTTVTPDAAQQCVLDAIRAMKFVPPPGRVTVSYPER